jgi:hypothetical protein
MTSPNRSVQLSRAKNRLGWRTIALIWFVPAVLAPPFKSKRRLEAENAVLQDQLIVLQRRLWDRTRAVGHSHGVGRAC